ncbi:hypothetical protein SLITO_v1c05360 [Spiroplasma litorale]|uniref:MOLPALP family lipoprotein n=1 Tax=Spiroplasma litorale TaxID=216942 RepID=A0A0K1W1I1_9MOLU|nr:hypothetical protein [Spiroplasma litorale]AKX34180.1 hypothetical protein SLITO_v1c05360 [Spiroplasma litorale]
MKKLISILGIISITSSSISLVTACGNANTIFDNSDDQENISKLMSQYAKALYINENEIDTTNEGLNKIHYSSSYLMKDYVKDNYIRNLNLGDFKNVETNDFTRYSDIASKYFKNSTDIVNDNTNVEDGIYKDGVVAPEVTGMVGTITSLVQSLPMILKSLSNPAAFGPLMSILSKKLKDLVSPALLKTLGKLIDNNVLKDLEKAFSVEAFKDDKGVFLSYEDGLNAGIIALSNSVDKIINKDESTEKLTYKNSSEINSNINVASEKIATNLIEILNGTKSLKLDILLDISSFPELIFFIRSLLVYLNSFSIKDLTTEYDGNNFIEMLETKRTAKIKEEENVFDFDNAIEVLSYVVNDTDSKGGLTLKNLLGVLLATPATDKENVIDATNINKKYEGGKNGLINILSRLAIKLVGEEKLVVDAMGKTITLYIDSVIRSFVNWGVGYDTGGKTQLVGGIQIGFSTLIALLPSFKDKLPDLLKNIVSNIDSKDWSEFFGKSGKWINYLYDNENEKLNLSIKKILSEPLENLLNSQLFNSGNTSEKNKIFDNKKDLGLGFLTSNSLQSIVNSIKADIDNQKKEKPDTNFKIKFDSFAILFKRLYTNNTFTKATEDVDNFMKILGLNDDSTIAKDSPLEQLQVIVNENLPWLNSVINTLSTMISSYNKKLSKTKEIVNAYYDNTEVSIVENKVNDYIYLVKNKTTNLENKFEIKLNYSGNYLFVSNIKKI